MERLAKNSINEMTKGSRVGSPKCVSESGSEQDGEKHKVKLIDKASNVSISQTYERSTTPEIPNSVSFESPTHIYEKDGKTNKNSGNKAETTGDSPIRPKRRCLYWGSEFVSIEPGNNLSSSKLTVRNSKKPIVTRRTLGSLHVSETLDLNDIRLIWGRCVFRPKSLTILDGGYNMKLFKYGDNQFGIHRDLLVNGDIVTYTKVQELTQFFPVEQLIPNKSIIIDGITFKLSDDLNSCTFTRDGMGLIGKIQFSDNKEHFKIILINQLMESIYNIGVKSVDGLFRQPNKFDIDGDGGIWQDLIYCLKRDYPLLASDLDLSKLQGLIRLDSVQPSDIKDTVEAYVKTEEFYIKKNELIMNTYKQSISTLLAVHDETLKDEFINHSLIQFLVMDKDSPITAIFDQYFESYYSRNSGEQLLVFNENHQSPDLFRISAVETIKQLAEHEILHDLSETQVNILKDSLCKNFINFQCRINQFIELKKTVEWNELEPPKFTKYLAVSSKYAEYKQRFGEDLSFIEFYKIVMEIYNVYGPDNLNSKFINEYYKKVNAK